jgi:magnesium transporter
MIVDCAVYEEGRRRDGDTPVHEAMEACREPGAFTWIGLYEPTEEEFDSIRREFDLHDLAVEDAIHAHQRPKLEVYDGMVFIVLKTARYVDPEEVVRLGEILIFLGHDYIITVRHGEASELKDVRHRLEEEPELLSHGPGAVLHAIVDKVVDDYGPALIGLGDDIDEIENQVFSGERANPAERIYKLKREVLAFSHAVGPLVDPVDRLSKGRYEVHPTSSRASCRPTWLR